ncbi:FAD-dependent oxidoreductase [Priestia megaterium]|nr:FAD-dependent oxidoreductase [Priestia megaterium]
MQHVDVLIIGGGPAGISAAVWCKRLGVDCLLLEE